MRFKIPYTISSTEVLKIRSKYFLKFVKNKETKLSWYLKNSDEKIERNHYLSICYRSFLLNLLILAVVFTSVLGILKLNYFYFLGVGVAFLISGFILFSQINYPRLYSLNKTRDIEKNLIPVMQDMLVQLNSGVPIFKIMVNISNTNYGEVSTEFKKIVAEINSGVSQIKTIEKYGKINTSLFFRRVLWQISNGMRAGSDMSIVIKEGIKNLSSEQAIQIQIYGNKLNPIIMFYMLIAVIIPALGITFLVIISSIVGIQGNIVKIFFAIIFFFVAFVQFMFLGVIKSRRPSLL